LVLTSLLLLLFGASLFSVPRSPPLRWAWAGTVVSNVIAARVIIVANNFNVVAFMTLDFKIQQFVCYALLAPK
jgi:hypothetical protein